MRGNTSANLAVHKPLAEMVGRAVGRKDGLVGCSADTTKGRYVGVPVGKQVGICEGSVDGSQLGRLVGICPEGTPIG